MAALYAITLSVVPLFGLGGSQLMAQQTSAPNPDAQMITSEGDMGPKVAILRALDKITARITELRVPVGDVGVKFGTLTIHAKTCRSNPPEETPETYVFLSIDDKKKTGDVVTIFDGWMVASSPALNPLEHPVYDVWAISCKTVSGDGEE